MDPFTLGLISIGAAGGTLAIVGGLQNIGVKINEGAVMAVLETTKYGAILYLLKSMANLL
ncbi:hypothetical protein QNH23_06570 [Siminovitchia fortis]|uniref:Uncharacterized protein n=1 Tax=Siminovitchia fortis TaxID=254758 RepID=A0A443IJ14_9BACI|nr:hypothetical protein [Siminovitchia fortis]RWR04127.1 hypothetical protein D4N35_017495 [Siminovitchia fortis]WHY83036.1 hypothetical protein QNH23_06570 [Siminovitchia fortis]